LQGNVADYYGGGIYWGKLINCLVAGNACNGQGGGTYNSILINCTVAGNSAPFGGGTAAGIAKNCIIYNNGSSLSYTNYLSGIFTNCCTTPNPDSSVNITNTPMFADLAASDFHLQSSSPCINAGNNSYLTSATDLDGLSRIAGGTVDIGAYEFKSPASVLSYAWAQQYSLPTDGAADNSDSDGDGMSNFAEWKSGTVPTNAASVLQLASPTNSVSGVTVTWQSVSGVKYFLQCGTNLAAQPIFSSIISNLLGQAGTTSYTDTSATNGGPYFYRVGVQ